jgi:hypothetical protein
MSRRSRRLTGSALAVGLMLLAVAAGQPGDAPQYTFRVVLGLKDRKPTDWSGQIAVAGGQVVGLSGWRFEPAEDSIKGTSGWMCRTRLHIAPGHRVPIEDNNGKLKGKVVEVPWPNGIELTVRGAAPTVTLTLAQGKLSFAAGDIALGEPRTFLDGQVRVERLPAVSILRAAAPPRTPHAVQDDYPAFWVHYKTGKHYLAWLAYQNGSDRVLLAARDGPEGKWSAPVQVDGPGQHFRVALAGTHGDTLWVVYAAQRDHNWDLYGRPYQGGKLGAEVRLTKAAGPDIWQRMTTDSRGRAWLVWQGFRGGQADIFARCADGDGWHEPIKVSTSTGNDWDPCIAADPTQDRVWIGWDSYHGTNYRVCIRSLTGGPAGTPGQVLYPEESPRFGVHVSLACDRAGRLWAAWDESGPQWGKDTGFLYGGGARTDTTRLYAWRHIRVKCLQDGKWLEPAADLHQALPLLKRDYYELPQLQADTEGRLWMAFRVRTCLRPRQDGWGALGRWDVYATAFLGDRWLPPVPLPGSAGRNDMRADSQRDSAGNVYFAYASDNRHWMPPTMLPRNHSIAVSRLAGAAAPVEPRLVARPKVEGPALVNVHPGEAEQVARVRKYKIEVGGKLYHIYRGDLHRHTDISVDGIGDGSLMDLHRYALDAAAFDYILVTDHNMGQDDEYCWWRTQQANDLYTVPRTFISMYGYERSVRYPNGHRNVIWPERGHRTLPLPQQAIPAQMEADTGKLYAYLRQTGGICTSHTGATDQGTDWDQALDPALEPIVELFQGFHTSYEMPGAPKAVSAQTDRIHGKFQPSGFISRALKKGYRLGFQASSDHISTHVSYACILAEEFSRKGLVEAMKKRHTYAATDNIVLDVRMDGHLMGDEVKTARPALDVVVLGTGPLDRVEVLRDDAVVHTHRPKEAGAEARFHWQDLAPARGPRASVYYVRVLQQNGAMAWASPLWVVPGE